MRNHTESLRPPTLAVFLPWGGLEGADRMTLTDRKSSNSFQYNKDRFQYLFNYFLKQQPLEILLIENEFVNSLYFPFMSDNVPDRISGIRSFKNERSFGNRMSKTHFSTVKGNGVVIKGSC